MATKKPTVEAPVFEKDALIEAAATFGTTPEIMAGALYDVNELITQDQAKKKLEAFLARPVK